MEDILKQILAEIQYVKKDVQELKVSVQNVNEDESKLIEGQKEIEKVVISSKDEIVTRLSQMQEQLMKIIKEQPKIPWKLDLTFYEMNLENTIERFLK